MAKNEKMGDAGIADTTNAPAQTLGQYRVGSIFNPSANVLVDNIKTAAAALIDQCDAFRTSATLSTPMDGEVFRLLALAQTAFEDGAMWAVKAVTNSPRVVTSPPASSADTTPPQS